MDTSPSRRRLRWVIALLGVAALAAVVLVLYTGYEGLKARQDLQRVASDLEKLSGPLASGGRAGARPPNLETFGAHPPGAARPAPRHTLQHAQADAAAAHRHTAGPGWWLTS